MSLYGLLFGEGVVIRKLYGSVDGHTYIRVWVESEGGHNLWEREAWLEDGVESGLVELCNEWCLRARKRVAGTIEEYV